jgi:ribonucleoside-diphosphate reductase alpha chain
MVVSFPVKSQNFEKSKSDITVEDQLKLIFDMQFYWSDNSVSSTVTFTKDEAADLLPLIKEYAPSLKSVSFLPISDHGYQQAPYIAITGEEYEQMRAEITELSLSDSHEVEERFCDGDTCSVL